MQPGLRAIGWGVQRLAIALAATVFAAVLAYSVVVFVMVAVQAVTAFKQ
jgi:hypothetical protein